MNRVKKIIFEYPIYVKRGSRTIVISEGSGGVSVNIPVGSYFLSTDTAKPDIGLIYNINFIEVLQDRLNQSALTNTYTVDLFEDFTIRISSSAPFTLLVNDSNFTLPLEILGLPPNFNVNIASTEDQIIFFEAPLGRWVVSSLDNDDGTYKPVSIINDWRGMNKYSVFQSETGQLATYNSFNGFIEANFSFRRIPSAAIWKYKGGSVPDRLEYLTQDGLVLSSNIRNNSFETFFENMGQSYTNVNNLFQVDRQVFFNAYNAAQYISIEMQFKENLLGGTNVIKYRAFPSNPSLMGDIWQMLSDDPIGGEYYEVRIPMVIEEITSPSVPDIIPEGQPPVVEGLVANFDARTLEGFETSDPVPLWEGLIQGETASQSDTGLQPTYVENLASSGTPGINGVNRAMFMSDELKLDGREPLTIMMVQFRAVRNSSGNIIGFQSGATGSYSLQLASFGRATGRVAGAATNLPPNDSWPTGRGIASLRAEGEGNTFDLRYNNSVYASSTVSTAVPNMDRIPMLFARDDGSGTPEFSINGSLVLQHLLVWDRALTESEMEEMHDWLEEEWALS